MNSNVKVSHINQIESETPTKSFIKEGIKEHIIVDSSGREIIIKKPTLVDQYRFVEALGDELSSNRTFCNMCNPLRFVSSIDGLHVSRPTCKREIYALIERIGEDGLISVVQGINKFYGDENETEAKETLKKG